MIPECQDNCDPYESSRNSPDSLSTIDTCDDSMISPQPSPKNSRPIKTLPLPKGESTYAQAKRAEYAEKNLIKAEILYRKAISEGDRIESAVKDLASLLHQLGKSQDGLRLLRKYKRLFYGNMTKFHNLVKTLQKTTECEDDTKLKCLKLSGLTPKDDEILVKSFFSNPQRIKSFKFNNERSEATVNYYCVLGFSSQSSARKTLDGFKLWDKYTVEWISNEGNVVCDAHYAKQKIDLHRKNNPTFDYILFERDPKGCLYSMPLDSFQGYRCDAMFNFEKEAAKLLGSELYHAIGVNS
jgi:hypothetical protein